MRACLTSFIPPIVAAALVGGLSLGSAPRALADDVGAARDLAEQAYIEALILDTVHRDFRRRLREGALSASDRDDYEAYLESLSARLEATCEAARLESDPASLPPACVTGESSGAGFDIPSAPPPGVPGGAQTAALGKELEESLGEFDGVLLEGQGRVKGGSPLGTDPDGEPLGGAKSSREPGEYEGSGRSGSDEEYDEEYEGGRSRRDGDREADGEADDDERESDSGRDSEGDRRDGDASGTSGPDSEGQRDGGLGRGPGEGADTEPDDLPDGSDDNLVARQLREAAEKETDPELKKKLWEEYRRYKRGRG